MRPFDWQANTPVELFEVVSHLRKVFCDWASKIDEVTKHLCFIAIHRDPNTEYLGPYIQAFEQMKLMAIGSTLLQFNILYDEGTPPGSFAAFFQIRNHLIEAQMLQAFQEFLTIAITQRALLQMAPTEWARTQAEALINQSYDTVFWIKSVCDIQPNTFSDLDEQLHWRQWRAPNFLIMKPSKFAPYDPKWVWGRQDEATSLKWLTRFARDLEIRLKEQLRYAAGQAQLTEAKTSPFIRSDRKNTHPSDNQAMAAIKQVSPEIDCIFSHTDDYQSIRFLGETYSLTERQAVIVGMLHKAHLVGHPDVAKRKLLRAIDAESSEVRDSFRKSALWNTLIRPGIRRGYYRIQLEVEPRE